MLLCPSGKRHDEVLDYLFDWTACLAGDTIASFAVSVSSGSVAVASQPPAAATATGVTFWLSGGKPGETCLITCSVVTAGGRTYEDQMSLTVLP